jgi:Domain of unknown function (DUF4192)
MTTTLTAHGPEDLLAAVPVVLGFLPRESLVMLTFGARQTFHARVDLPPLDDPATGDEVVDALVEPCRRQGVHRVALVFYTDDAVLAAALTARLVPALVAEGVGLVGVLRAHGGRWCEVPLRAGASESVPLPYDEASHPFAAEAVFTGRVTLPDRESLRDLVAPRAEVRARWAALEAAVATPGTRDRTIGLETTGAETTRAETTRAETTRAETTRAETTGTETTRAETTRAGVVEQVTSWVETGVEPDDEGAIRVLRAVTDPLVRDDLIAAVTEETARDHLRVWSALLRGAPDPAVPDVASVVAFCAWQTGDGALAWCALDRCFEVDPAHRLGACLAECLRHAVPPTAWRDSVVAGQSTTRRGSRRIGGSFPGE